MYLSILGIRRMIGHRIKISYFIPWHDLIVNHYDTRYHVGETGP